MVSWFLRKKTQLPGESGKKSIPDGVWLKCEKCKEIIYRAELEKNLKVCPKCDYHYRLSAKERLGMILDEGSFLEYDADLAPADPLRFKDSKKYKDRIKSAAKETHLKEAVISGGGRITGFPIQTSVFDFRYMGGSMGSVVGEKITRCFERSRETLEPAVVVSCSGGARMQEGMFSLMQMAKTSAAIARLGEAGVPYISVLTDPTMGGVTASLSMLGDIIIAEPGALVGFAGPRVIEQTIRQKLPDGFQRSEFLKQHGLIDEVIHRRDLRGKLALMLDFFRGGGPSPSESIDKQGGQR